MDYTLKYSAIEISLMFNIGTDPNLKKMVLKGIIDIFIDSIDKEPVIVITQDPRASSFIWDRKCEKFRIGNQLFMYERLSLTDIEKIKQHVLSEDFILGYTKLWVPSSGFKVIVSEMDNSDGEWLFQEADGRNVTWLSNDGTFLNQKDRIAVFLESNLTH
jgi:hypothetical protein